MSSAANKNFRAKKPVDILQQRIPENPKYKNVKATVDTGASLTRYMNKIEEIKKNYKFGKDEIFKRMKATTFVQLLIQVHRFSHPDDFDDLRATPSLSSMRMERPETADLELQRLQQNGSPTPSLALTDGDFGGRGEPDSSRSTLLSVASGVGELDLNQPHPASKIKIISDLCPYLLLDIRDRDEYDQCRIASATSYPKANLSRAVNFETKEMLAYRNKEGKVIIIYDEDERLGPVAATTLVQRGYDNLFLLSGGLRVAYKLFPEGLLSGTPPFSVSGVKSKTVVKPATQNGLTNDDVNRMEIYLDQALQDKSSGSRLSKASTANSRISSSRSVSSSVSRTSSVLTDRPAFK